MVERYQSDWLKARHNRMGYVVLTQAFAHPINILQGVQHTAKISDKMGKCPTKVQLSESICG